MFQSLLARLSGWLQALFGRGCTTLHGRFKGQLVATTAVDGHNWMFPVAYGVLEGESHESWTWFLQNLRELIGHPPGLVIQTDACKGLETAVEAVFPGVEHWTLGTEFYKEIQG